MDALSPGPDPSVYADIEAIRASSSAQWAEMRLAVDSTAKMAAPSEETSAAIALVDAKVMALDNQMLSLRLDLERTSKTVAAKSSDDHRHAIADLDARFTVFDVDCSMVVAKAREEVANTSKVVDSLAVTMSDLSTKLSNYELLSAQQQETIDAFRTTIARLESQVASALAPPKQPTGMALQAMQARSAQPLMPPAHLGLASVRTPALAAVHQTVAQPAPVQDTLSQAILYFLGLKQWLLPLRRFQIQVAISCLKTPSTSPNFE